MASRLLSSAGVETTKNDRTSPEPAGASRREDRFDAILRWVHRLLNPPSPSPVRAQSGTRRRIRDRVPI